MRRAESIAIAGVLCLAALADVRPRIGQSPRRPVMPTPARPVRPIGRPARITINRPPGEFAYPVKAAVRAQELKLAEYAREAIIERMDREAE